jgi:peptidoglycan hydrolase-like amidase
VSYETESQKTDADGKLISQIYNASENEYQELTEEDLKNLSLYLESIRDDITSQLDITLSTLREAIVGTGANEKTQKDLWDKIEAVRTKMSSDPATQTTLAAVLAKLADPATETTVDDIKTAVESMDTDGIQLKGSIEEYTWDSGDAEPDPGSGVRAFGVKHDSGDFTAYYWDGSSWGEI